MKAQTMRRLRQLHHYVGVFFAPAIIFFALSGAAQTFRLQEEKGYGGPPPGWIVWMASVHKDQALPRAEAPREAAPRPKAAPLEHRPPAAPRPSPLPLKIFVLLVAAGLIASSALGVLIALNNRAMRRTSIVMLAAGTALPLLLLLV